MNKRSVRAPQREIEEGGLSVYIVPSIGNKVFNRLWPSVVMSDGARSWHPIDWVTAAAAGLAFVFFAADRYDVALLLGVGTLLLLILTVEWVDR
jgi:hypothetical protein